MKLRLVALALAVAGMVSCFGASAQARELNPPGLGCHRVYITPPGWGQPIEVTVCP